MTGCEDNAEVLQIRIAGDAGLPTLVYLPGLHGDWTLIASFRAAVAGRVRFVEFTYPRTLTWSLEDYARAVEAALLAHGIRRGWLLAESFGSQVAWLLAGPRGMATSTAAESDPRLRAEGAPGEPTVARAELALGASAEGTQAKARGYGDVAAREGLTVPAQVDARRFCVEGLVLAGGFVRYPARWRVVVAQWICQHAPLGGLRLFLGIYARFARFRHRHAPETRTGIGEFVARRTDLDRQAIAHRLRLILANDPRGLARGIREPVFHLVGFWDPVVPRRRVGRWLRQHCPGFRAGCTVWYADHNVLSTAPNVAADRVFGWINHESAGSRT